MIKKLVVLAALSVWAVSPAGAIEVVVVPHVSVEPVVPHVTEVVPHAEVAPEVHSAPSAPHPIENAPRETVVPVAPWWYWLFHSRGCEKNPQTGRCK